MFDKLQSVLAHLKVLVTPPRVIVALTAVGAVAGVLLPDKIAINGGFGWDGAIYGGFAQDFWARYHTGVSAYYVGRLLPSLFIYQTLRVLSVPLTEGNVVLAFGVLNAVMLAASAWLWTRIARRLDLGPIGLWFGYVAAFASCFALKMISYYPVLTDATAFFLGWAMLAAYLEGSTWLLLVCILVGQFTWPTVLPVGAILLIWPFSRDVGAGSGPDAPYAASLRAGVLAVVPALAVAVLAFAALHKGGRPLPNLIDVLRPAWPLSVICSCAYLATALFLLLRGSPGVLRLRPYLEPFRHRATYFKVVLLVGLAMVDRLLPSRSVVPIGKSQMFELIAWNSVVAPLRFLVAHVTYFGPVVLILVLGWRTVARMIGESGPGLTLWAILAVLLSLDSESRHLVNVAPVLIAFVAKAVDTHRPRARALFVFTALSLLVSKVWLVIGTERSLYFLNAGPWMSHEQYAVQGAFMLVIAYWCVRSGIVPGSSPARGPGIAMPEG